MKPLFAYYQSMYFGSRSDLDSILGNTGPGATQWPYSFEQAPAQMPTVIKTVSFDSAPTAVKTTQWSSPQRAWIATEDGQPHIFDLGDSLTTHTAAVASSIVEVGAVTVGRNPTSLSPFRALVGSTGNDINENVVVLSRGDKRIEWVKFTGNTGAVTRTLRDSRMVDPIAIDDLESHGTEAPLVSAADFGAKSVMTYNYGPVIFHTNPNGSCPAPNGCGLVTSTGQPAEFEFGGALVLPGKPFLLTNANCP